jgi:NADH-quinone oxidoreductase subunit C
MPDENKPPASSPQEGEPKPTADKAARLGGVKATTSGSVQSEAKSGEPGGVPPPGTPPKPDPGPAPPPTSPPLKAVSAPTTAGTPVAAAGTPAAKPAAPAKTGAPAPTAWNSPMVAKLKGQFGSGVEALTYLSQNYMTVDRSLIPEILQVLHNDEQFDYCVDVTALHYPQREKKEFDVIWILYSYARNERIRVKTQIGDGESIPSSVPIWPAANWLEREVYDMFGIKFDGHPDMKRILLPEGWKGQPGH